MKLIQLSPGAGNMYCGNCLRDNALAAELHRQGNDVCMVPLYLPLTLDEADNSLNTPIFFGGISVYLEQKLPIFRYIPRFVHRLLASRQLLKRLGSRAASTQPSLVGELMVSMLQGEQGHQAAELDELCRWLKTERPDVVSFSNLLLLGMHTQIKSATGAKTVCFLTGEDAFLDAVSEPCRTEAWNLVRRHVINVDFLIAPSRYFADYMEQRLELAPGRIHVIYPGINLEGFDAPTANSVANSAAIGGINLGYFARMNSGKGLDTLVDAFIEIKRRNQTSALGSTLQSKLQPTLQLKAGGGFSPQDEPFLDGLKCRLNSAGLGSESAFFPNVSRKEKITLLKSLTLFSVPSRLNEAFGLFVLESMGAGVPGIFPNRGAFPEILEQTQGCLLFEPEQPNSLADSIEQLLADDSRRRELAQNAETAVRDNFLISAAAKRFVKQIGG